MNATDAVAALTEGQPAKEVALAFMQARASASVTRLCSDLMDLMDALDGNIGIWTLEPPGHLSTLRIQSEVLSALSVAWKAQRPSTNPGWRYELRAVMLVLNGRYRTVAVDQLTQDVGHDLAKVIAARQPERVVVKGKKKVAVAKSEADA
jgi:hypothetical protein